MRDRSGSFLVLPSLCHLALEVDATLRTGVSDLGCSTSLIVRDRRGILGVVSPSHRRIV